MRQQLHRRVAARRLAEEGIREVPAGTKIVGSLQTAANGILCLYANRGDFGIEHQPLVYDDLPNPRLKGFLPTGISILTGSYDVTGWQNVFAVIGNADSPLTGVMMRRRDGMFGSQRAGGRVRTKRDPKLARGPEGDIRRWCHLDPTGAWADRPIDTRGFRLRYSTAGEFSGNVLKSSDKLNGNLRAFGNSKRPDGTTYLITDQTVNYVAKDPGGIGYVRYHEGFPKTVTVLAIANTETDPNAPPTLETDQDRSYPLSGEQSICVQAKPGRLLDPKIADFIRFVSSRQCQALIEQDAKFLPLTPKVQLSKCTGSMCSWRDDRRIAAPGTRDGRNCHD